MAGSCRDSEYPEEGPYASERGVGIVSREGKLG